MDTVHANTGPTRGGIKTGLVRPPTIARIAKLLFIYVHLQ